MYFIEKYRVQDTPNATIRCLIFKKFSQRERGSSASLTHPPSGAVVVLRTFLSSAVGSPDSELQAYSQTYTHIHKLLEI